MEWGVWMEIGEGDGLFELLLVVGVVIEFLLVFCCLCMDIWCI